MKCIFVICIAFIFLTGCQESTEKKFERNGISFTCPSGWKITEEENLNNQGYYLSIEKDGFNSSGILTMTWAYDSLDLDEWLEIIMLELKDNIVHQYSNLTFVTPVNNVFNKYESLSVNFDFSVLGLKHEGIIHVLYGRDKTIAILKQEAIEDKEKNIDGFDTIEHSFKIK